MAEPTSNPSTPNPPANPSPSGEPKPAPGQPSPSQPPIKPGQGQGIKPGETKNVEVSGFGGGDAGRSNVTTTKTGPTK